MSAPGVWFTDLEFQAAAYAFDVPIIIFSPLHKMSFYDCLFEAKTKEGMKKVPVYILHNGKDHFNPLLQKNQKEIWKFMENNGSVLERFELPAQLEINFEINMMNAKKSLGINTKPPNDRIRKIEDSIREVK